MVSVWIPIIVAVIAGVSGIAVGVLNQKSSKEDRGSKNLEIVVTGFASLVGELQGMHRDDRALIEDLRRQLGDCLKQLP